VVTPQSRVALRRRHDATVGLVTPFPKRVGAQLAVDGTPPAEPSGFALAYARAAESAGARSKQPSAAYVVGGWNVNLLVELRGFEPLTPSMPWRCATSCATAPWAMRNRAAGTPDYSRPSPATAPPTASSRAASRASTSRSTHGIAGQSFHSRSRA